MKNLQKNIQINITAGVLQQTAMAKNIIYADEENPRLIVLWGGYAFAKEYNAPRGHFYAVTDVRNILRTGAPKLQMMALKLWHVGHVKVLMFHV